MNCPDCTDKEMKVDSFNPNRSKDLFEIVWKCPSCGEVFFATIYREEKGEVK